ncbi:MAG: LPS translocon maturation chaperone LptM [Guyparkeria sp.]
MPRPFAILLITTLFFAPLTGCGQKGPLYLPDDQSEQGNAPADRSN